MPSPRTAEPTVNVTKTPEQCAVLARRPARRVRAQALEGENLAVMNWSDRSMRELTHEETKDHLWALAGGSRNAELFYATRGNIGSTDADVYRVDVASGHAENLTPHQGEVLYSVASVSPDGKTPARLEQREGRVREAPSSTARAGSSRELTDTQLQAMPGGFSALQRDTSPT